MFLTYFWINNQHIRIIDIESRSEPFGNTTKFDLSDGDFIVLELSADQLHLAQQVGHLSHSSILLSERILLTMTTIVGTTVDSGHKGN